MITYLELPLSGTYKVNGHDVLLVGLYMEQGQAGCVYVDQDGSMGQAQLSDIVVNWRFDDNRRKWIDVDTGDDLESGDGDGSNQR